jgi:hypothetical protein
MEVEVACRDAFVYTTLMMTMKITSVKNMKKTWTITLT